MSSFDYVSQRDLWTSFLLHNLKLLQKRTSWVALRVSPSPTPPHFADRREDISLLSAPGTQWLSAFITNSEAV